MRVGQIYGMFSRVVIDAVIRYRQLFAVKRLAGDSSHLLRFGQLRQMFLAALVQIRCLHLVEIARSRLQFAEGVADRVAIDESAQFEVFAFTYVVDLL